MVQRSKKYRYKKRIFLETDLPNGNLKRTRSTKICSFNSLTDIKTPDKMNREEIEKLEIYLSAELLRYKKMIKRRLQENHKKSKFKEKSGCFELYNLIQKIKSFLDKRINNTYRKFKWNDYKLIRKCFLMEQPIQST
jgi:hypothetical protein